MQLLELLARVFFLLPLLLFLLLPLSLFHLLARLLFSVFLLSKGLEHILIVQEGMRELILEVGIVEELRDSPLDEWHLQNGIDGGTLRRVLLEQSRHQVIQGWAVLLGDFIELALDDTLC